MLLLVLQPLRCQHASVNLPRVEFNLEVKGSCFVLDPFRGSVRVMQYSLLPPPSDQKNRICKYQTYVFLSIA